MSGSPIQHGAFRHPDAHRLAFVAQVADVLYRIYNLRARMTPTVQGEVEAYYERHVGDYDALAYGAKDCRLARFIHNRIVPLSKTQ
jgi:hypothetical protein